MRELFEREDWGKELEQHCRKTKEIDIHTNSQVYEVTKDMPKHCLKAGDKFYLDKFHGDHLEVFRKWRPLKALNTKPQKIRNSPYQDR